MKVLDYTEKTFKTLYIIAIGIGLLALLGIYNPLEEFKSAIKGDVIEKLNLRAQAGDADAQNKLGTFLYTEAQEQQGDFTEAIMWLEKAHQQNNPIAELNLAFAYKSGTGVALDSDKAIELFYQAGLNFLRLGFPMDAKDCVYEIAKLNAIHPLKRGLINAIKKFEANSD
tara:strand:- start:148498 stop:149007 length:510 start_codon:yes stop_codon:yes gene_type:complete